MARDPIETDIRNMPDPEFKATIIRLASLEESMEDPRESLTTEIKDLKASQTTMNEKS